MYIVREYKFHCFAAFYYYCRYSHLFAKNTAVLKVYNLQLLVDNKLIILWSKYTQHSPHKLKFK